MIQKSMLEKELERLTAITSMVQTYEEIAAIRMQHIRNSVLRTRSVLEGLSKVFSTVKSSYKHEVMQAMKKKKQKKTKETFLTTNGKTACVFLSANTGLYGDIVKKTFAYFLQTVKEKDCDPVIIGQLGKQLFSENDVKKEAAYFPLSDGLVTSEQLAQILLFLLPYENVFVFYGQFQSVVTQKPAMTTLASDTDMSKDSSDTKPIVKYLFEPSLQNVMKLFEEEIFASLFEQTVHEASLAKFASRMILLDQALDNIKKTTKLLVFDKQKLKHKDQNSKQQMTMSSMSLWQ